MQKFYDVIIDDRQHSGTAEDIIKILMGKHFFNTYDSPEQYVEEMSKDVWRLYGIGIDPNGSTLNEKLESFLDQMINKGLLKAAN